MVRLVTGFVGALQFLTRIPIRVSSAVPHRRTLPWFPAVGLLVGAACGAVAAGLAEWLPVTTAAAVGVIVGLLVTGAFHEDGLADIADAFGGGWTREQRFEILKDSRHGTYGVAALSGSIVVRVIAAGSIVGRSELFVGFIVAHVLGRLAAVGVLAAGRPASDSGLGVTASTQVPRVPVAVSFAATVGVLAAVAGWWAAPLLAVAATMAAAVTVLSYRKIGGLTGDTLGAVEQIVECAVLVTVSGLALHHQVWWD